MRRGIERLRGFREVYPEDQRVRRRLFQAFVEVAQSFGFEEVEAPSVEPLELFRLKSGEEILAQTWSFRDKGGREVTLVPELTPSIARMVARRRDLPRPLKWFSIAKMWRYEEPQAGRLREFWQFNADIFGSPYPEADAEVIALSCAYLDRVGLRSQYEVRVSDRYSMEAILGPRAGEIFPIIDRMPKVGEGETRAALSALGLSDSEAERVLEIASVRGRWEEVRSTVKRLGAPDYRLRVLDELFLVLDSYGLGDRVIVDLSTVRGLAYYTGIVYEGRDRAGRHRAIFGGGRYDGVVSLLGGRETPATGMGMGDAVLELMLREAGLWGLEAPRADAVVMWMGGDRELSLAARAAAALREAGLRVDLEVMRRRPSRVLSRASREGVRLAVIVGEEEASAGEVSLKDLESGRQVRVPVGELPSAARALLGG